jgi:GAF domain-containing protein
LADSLVRGYDVVELMQQLADTCVDLLHCDAAGLMLVDSDGFLRVMASSTEQMRMLELLEVQNSDGPCLDCFRSGEPVSATDLNAVEGHWAAFAPAALQAGFTSARALPLRLRDTTIGALSLLFSGTDSMSADDLALAQALADVATIGILQERALREREIVNEQLQSALNNRIVIEQVKGVLAERGGLSIDEAYSVFREYCRFHRTTSSEAARQLLNGTLDPSTVLRRERRRPNS